MRKPNIILIVCDTLRKDIVDLYGGPAEMPNLRTLAEDSVVYKNAIAPAPWTFPSHVSLFTGLYPSEHGIHETEKRKMPGIIDESLRSRRKTLAEYLHERGYATFGISANLMISTLTGFGRGFDKLVTFTYSPWVKSDLATQARNLGGDPMQVISVLLKRGEAGKIPRYGIEYLKIRLQARKTDYPLKKGAEEVNRIAFTMLRKRPFFLFLNYYEAHEPYRKFSDKETQDHLTGIKQISRARVRYLKQQYIEEAEYLDTQIGALIEGLKKRGLYDDSLIILTSDHGQAFGEHGFLYHGTFLYDQVVRVPLVIKYPKNEKLENSRGYQSLVGIFGLIRSVMEGGGADFSTKSAYSEAFGNAEFFPEAYKHRMWYVKKTYEKLRKAVYSGGYKLSVNGSDRSVDEFLHGEASASMRSQKHRKKFKEMSEELRRFKGGERFSLPRAR